MCSDAWGFFFGIRRASIRPDAGERPRYEVGARAVTELECQRLQRGEPPLWGPLMGQDLHAK